jgi:hypothetical protein
VNWSWKFKKYKKYNGNIQKEVRPVLITGLWNNVPLEGVQDLGGYQMVLKSPAVKQLASDNCPYGVGAVGKIKPPQW